MKKVALICLIAAVCLIIVGALTAFAAYASVNYDYHIFTGPETAETYDVTEEFTSISANAACDLKVVLSTDGKAKVEYRGAEKGTRKVEVRDGKLEITAERERSFPFFDFNFIKSGLTVYLPEKEYASFVLEGQTGDVELPVGLTFESVRITVSTGDVQIHSDVKKDLSLQTSTGDVKAGHVSCGTLNVKTSTGDVDLMNVSVEGDAKIKVSTGKVKADVLHSASLSVFASTGDITLNLTRASGAMTINTSTGDVTFNRSDASEISVKTSTGDVRGTLLTGKLFDVDTSTGDRNYPRYSTGGRCYIRTSTGDVNIEVVG